MPLEFLAWNSPPLDYSRITLTVILIKITIVIIMIITMIVKHNNSSTNIIVRLK